MVMGRGSDTRMYSPRSESDKMYSSANEDETKYNPASPEYNEQKRDEKKRKEEEKKERKSKIKHIKISSKQKLGGDESLDGLDDGNKRDDEREMGLQGGPAGSRGTLLDLATGAKSGTGSAMSPGLPIAMSEPMEDAWSTLLKEDDDVPDMSNFGSPYDPDTRIPELSMDDLWRLRHHPNPRIRHKANEEMEMRSMDAEGSNLPFDETTPAGEVAAFYEPQFQDLNFQYGNQQPPDLEDGEYNEEGYDEHYSQERAGDVLEAMPGDIEFFPSLAAKYEHLKNTAPPEVVENYRNRIKNFFDEYTQPSEILGTTLPPQFIPELPKGTFYTPEEVMQQSDKINEALNIYPGGNSAYTGFTDNFQNKLASKPMEDAWSSLLKEDSVCPNCQGTGKDPNQKGIPEEGIEPGECEPCDGSGMHWVQTPLDERGFPIESYEENDPNWQDSIETGEPMEDAWSSLLKEEPTVHPGENQYKHRYNMPNRDNVHPEWYDWIQETLDNPAEYEGIADDFTQPDINHLAGATSREDFFERLYDLHNFQVDDARPPFDDIEHVYRDFTNVPFNEETGFTMSEPMEDAWSTLLKRDTAKTIAARRRREARQQFRPSTGQFKTPPGGMSGGVGATKRRHAARMRGISSGKKTGLMKPHLSVEMSHRGIATKQPMSKDPQKYTAYRGQSEARKIQGNVRTPFSPRGRFGQRSFSAGPTGAGRLSGLLAGQRGQMTQPSLRQLGVRRPRIRRPRRPPMPSMPSMPMMQSSVPSMPAAPSSIMMSEDAQEYSELLKARNIARRYELLNLMRRLIQAKEKEAKKIKKYVQGGGSAFENGHVPDHPAGVQQHEDEDEKNDGPTQNLETNSSRLGLDPAGALISRRGHMG